MNHSTHSAQEILSMGGFLVAVLAGKTEKPVMEDHTYSQLQDDIPDLHTADLEAEGDVETYNDPFGTGDAYTEFEVELTHVRHKDSGRSIFLSALTSDVRDALEQKVLDAFLQGRW